MPAPVQTVIDNLYAIRDILSESERFAEAANMDILIEAANRAGHSSPTWDGVVREVRNSIEVVRDIFESFQPDTLDLIDLALSRPSN